MTYMIINLYKISNLPSLNIDKKNKLSKRFIKKKIQVSDN